GGGAHHVPPRRLSALRGAGVICDKTGDFLGEPAGARNNGSKDHCPSGSRFRFTHRRRWPRSPAPPAPRPRGRIPLPPSLPPRPNRGEGRAGPFLVSVTEVPCDQAQAAF